MIVVYDTIRPIPKSVISRVLNTFRSEKVVFKFTSELKQLNRRTEVLILTSYRPKDLLAVCLSCPDHLIFVQHGMQTTISLKRDIASRISAILGIFVRRKDAIVFNTKARIPYGISKRNIKRVNFSDKNAERISFKANTNEVLLIDQPLYSHRLFKDYAALRQKYEVLVKWHPRSTERLEGMKVWGGEPVSKAFGYSSSLMLGIKDVPVYSLLTRNEIPFTLEDYFDYTKIENDLGIRLNPSKLRNSTDELESVIKELIS